VGHVGGQLQARFMARVRGRDLGRCLVVPVDVGKSMAMALVADHYGEIVVAPFEFQLTETGFSSLAVLYQACGIWPPGGHRRAGRSARPTSLRPLAGAGLNLVLRDVFPASLRRDLVKAILRHRFPGVPRGAEPGMALSFRGQ
jgi:hypothetical protein